MTAEPSDTSDEVKVRHILLSVILAMLGLPVAVGAALAGGPPQGDELAAVPRISQAEFKKALARNTILVIDVRDAGSYGNGHIAGAVSIPLSDLPAHLQQLKAEHRPIVTYCA